ncbi:hypothetical protein KL928_002058 [Ogataea angusta]|uniref:Uncharacterized protein n=1 Tax=Pichia angusta TaxID=870730 RepID=A0AAN6I717_PICAN|nr:uncharacterized protein KL928_002058 [Ogataea angusta]KAG7819384.1 hypothetical protein KL928_002058 [Ogataea angusta]
MPNSLPWVVLSSAAMPESCSRSSSLALLKTLQKNTLIPRRWYATITSRRICTADESTDVMPSRSNTTCLIGRSCFWAAGCTLTEPHSSSRRSRALRSLVLVNVRAHKLVRAGHPGQDLDPRLGGVLDHTDDRVEAAERDAELDRVHERRDERDDERGQLVVAARAQVEAHVSGRLLDEREADRGDDGVQHAQRQVVDVVEQAGGDQQRGEPHHEAGHGGFRADERVEPGPAVATERRQTADEAEREPGRAERHELSVGRDGHRETGAETLARGRALEEAQYGAHERGREQLRIPLAQLAAEGHREAELVDVDLAEHLDALLVEPEVRREHGGDDHDEQNLGQEGDRAHVTSGKRLLERAGGEQHEQRRGADRERGRVVLAAVLPDEPRLLDGRVHVLVGRQQQQHRVKPENRDRRVDNHGEPDRSDKPAEQRAAEHVVDEAEAQQPEHEQDRARERRDHHQNVHGAHPVVVLDDFLDRLPDNHRHGGLGPDNHLRHRAQHRVHGGRERQPQQPAHGRHVRHRVGKRHAQRDLVRRQRQAGHHVVHKQIEAVRGQPRRAGQVVRRLLRQRQDGRLSHAHNVPRHTRRAYRSRAVAVADRPVQRRGRAESGGGCGALPQPERAVARVFFSTEARHGARHGSE